MEWFIKKSNNNMKFLQIKKDGGLIPPKVLEMGVDFDMIDSFGLIKTNFHKYRKGDSLIIQRIVKLSDCYQARPLIEIDGFCEFDIYIVNGDVNNAALCRCSDYFLAFIFNGFRYDPRCKFENIGSIFDPGNQAKYPKLYQEALDIIYKTLETKI